MGAIQTLANIFAPRDSVTVIQQEWPPANERNRIDGYRRYRQILEGNHMEAFGDREDFERYGVYIAANLPELIVTKTTDMLFSEEPDFEFAEGTPDEKQDAVNGLWRDNNLRTLFYEAGIDQGALGDSVFEVSRDADGEVGFNSIPVENWFPICDEDNKRKVLGHIFAWRRVWVDSNRNEVDLVKMRIHRKGSIENKLYIEKSGKLVREVTPDAPMWVDVMGELEQVQEIPEVPDDFLVVHIPNKRTARDVFGWSEYKGKESLYSALDARLTQYDFVLTHHAEPKMKVPPGIIDEHGEVDTARLAFIETSDRDTDVAEYITYDAKLEDSSRIIKELTDKILMLSGIDRATVGLVEGGGPESGRALKLRQTGTLSVVARRQMYFGPGIAKLLELAQRLMGDQHPAMVTVKFADGLPQDPLEDAEYAESRLASGSWGVADAIEFLDDVDRDEAERRAAELEKPGMESLIPTRAAIPPPVLGNLAGIEDGDTET